MVLTQPAAAMVFKDGTDDDVFTAPVNCFYLHHREKDLHCVFDLGVRLVCPPPHLDPPPLPLAASATHISIPPSSYPRSSFSLTDISLHICGSPPRPSRRTQYHTASRPGVWGREPPVKRAAGTGVRGLAPGTSPF